MREIHLLQLTTTMGHKLDNSLLAAIAAVRHYSPQTCADIYLAPKTQPKECLKFTPIRGNNKYLQAEEKFGVPGADPTKAPILQRSLQNSVVLSPVPARQPIQLTREQLRDFIHEGGSSVGTGDAETADISRRSPSALGT